MGTYESKALRGASAGGPAGPTAELKVFGGQVLVRDHLRRKDYRVSLTSAETGQPLDLGDAEAEIRGRWEEIRVSAWASPKNLRDPEMASALRAVQAYAAETLRLRRDAVVPAGECLTGRMPFLHPAGGHEPGRAKG